jgi:hypothetical protein
MRWSDAWVPRNCWLNPDCDDAIKFACCMVNIGYCLIWATGMTVAARLLWRLLA